MDKLNVTGLSSYERGILMTQESFFPASFPPQHQDHQPGIESEMNPQPIFELEGISASQQLQDKTVLITGGDSGIGRAVAIACARAGAHVSIVYLNEHEDALAVSKKIEQIGRRSLRIATDVGQYSNCQMAVKQTIEAFGQIDILINNAAEQHPQQRFGDITEQQTSSLISS
jgi:hypothetical protein